MKNNIPTEDEIENLLGRIQPLPKPGFHQKMAKKPWNLTGQASFGSSTISMRAAISLGFVLILVLGISFFSPSLNTLAQRFALFFSPSPSMTDVAITALETSQPLERFHLTITEAEDLFGFEMKIPDGIPEEFRLSGAAYDELREAVILNYTTDLGDLVLRISKQKADADYQAIGPEAVVEIVTIGPYFGEFVSGGWMIPEVESGVDAMRNPYTLQAVWETNVNLQTLRWSDGEFLFEIILAGGNDQIGYIDKDDLIALANNMH